jgi:U3 small nucleolar ribonucleoprotein component
VGGEKGNEAELVHIHGVRVVEEAVELRRFSRPRLAGEEVEEAPLDDGIHHHRDPQSGDEPLGAAARDDLVDERERRERRKRKEDELLAEESAEGIAAGQRRSHDRDRDDHEHAERG